MKLNKEAKKEARKMIEEAVKDIPEGQKLQFDKELLEQLLFETKEIKIYDEFLKEKFGTAKFVVWITPYLSKIDLSEVSFDNVCWSPLIGEELYDEFVENLINKEYPSLKNDHIDSKRNAVFDLEPKIDLSNTNAKIDFSKAFGTDICCFNFANTDLSNNILSETRNISSCNFVNTGIRLDFKESSIWYANNANLSNIDLSSYTVSDSEFFDRFYNCNLSNTELKIKTVDNEMYDDAMKESLENGFLDGCYIDGEYIIEYGKIRFNPEEPEEFYKMIFELRESVRQSIEEQTNKKGRR